MINAGRNDATAAVRRLHRRRRRGALAAAMLAAAVLVVVVITLATTHHHVTVVRVISPGASATVDAPHATLTTPQGAPALPVAPTPQQAAASAAAPPTASAATPPTPSPDSLATVSPLLRPGASASFQRLTATLPGSIELAVTPLGAGATEILGGDAAAHGWSTTKVPVLVSLLRARGETGLTAQERVWANAAITASDNQSILDLFGDLEQLEGGLNGASEYIDTVLRSSGDDQTTVATAPPPPGAVTTFGQTEWSPSEALKFFRALARGCLLQASQTAYVLGLMENIESSESWGLGSAAFDVPVAFKGGWGPEPSGSYLVRQSGIIDPGSARGVAVAIVAFPSDAGSGSFPAGTQMLTEAAQWLQRELRLTAHPTVPC
jgi:hypothetical protein